MSSLKCWRSSLPGLISYNLLVTRIENLVNKLEAKSTEFMDLLNEPVKK